MNILSINTYPNNAVLFQAKPKNVLTPDLIKMMPNTDILELSAATLKNQDIDIIRLIHSKIKNLLQVLTSRYNYLKTNELNFSIKEIEQTKTNKKKAKRIDKLLSEKIREEKIKRGMELNPNKDDFIPIEYLILPEEEKIHNMIIKIADLNIDITDANKYKYQKAKHDRNIARSAVSLMGKMFKKEANIEYRHKLDIYDMLHDFENKKTYNEYAEKILFADTKVELEKLQEKICQVKLYDDFKNDLLELIKRKTKLL